MQGATLSVSFPPPRRPNSQVIKIGTIAGVASGAGWLVDSRTIDHSDVTSINNLCDDEVTR